MNKNLKIIKCPDHGYLKLHKHITFEIMKKYLNNYKKNVKSAADNLILEVVLDDVSIDNLTTKDKYKILKEITSEFQITKVFKDNFSEDCEYYEAFKIAFETSEFIENIEKSNIGIDSALNFVKVQQNMHNSIQKSLLGASAAQKMIESVSKFTIPNAFDISKFASSSLAIQKQASIYQQAIQNIQFPLTNQFLNNKTFEINLLSNQADLFRNINKLSITNIEHIRNAMAHNRSLINPISIISKRYNEINSIYNLSESLLKNLTLNLDVLKQSSNINWDSQLKYAAELVSNSNETIGATHNYFTKVKTIDAIYTPDLTLNNVEKRDLNELTSGLNESEIIIQDNASSSLLFQKEYGDLILNKLDQFQNKIEKYIPILDHFEKLSNPKSFLDFLDEFANIVSREYWGQFWKVVGKTFNSSPESIAKSNLGLFLSGRYSNYASIGQELIAGNGFVDLLVNFFGKLYLVELKVIGVTTSISWAKKGIEQLSFYMEKYNLDKSYLVVYDGRKTEKGEQLDDYYDVENGRIYVKKIKIYYSPRS